MTTLKWCILCHWIALVFDPGGHPVQPPARRRQGTQCFHPVPAIFTVTQLISYSTCLFCLQVAILCNHQRAVGKAHDSQMEKMQEKLAGLREGLAELREDLKLAKAGKPKKGDDEGKPKKLDPDACASAPPPRVMIPGPCLHGCCDRAGSPGVR